MTDKYLIKYSDYALEDLKSIFEYISFQLKEPNVAVGQVERIRKAIRELDCMPKRYSLVNFEPWQERKVRKMQVDNYLVFYIADDMERNVKILRIIYGMRDIPNIIQTP